MATSGEKRWPPVGNFVAASGEKPMAIDTVVHAAFARAGRQLPQSGHAPGARASGDRQTAPLAYEQFLEITI